MRAEDNPIVLFSTPEGDVRVNAVLADRTMWLTQKAMAGLFGVRSQAITRHLKNIYQSRELQVGATCSKMEQVQDEGGRKADVTQAFYATIQNKFHYAITGETAAEIVYRRADASKDHMGLSTWRNAPDGRVLKSDSNIAKNYLTAEQVRDLERAVSGYFDYIEGLLQRHVSFTMEEFAKSVDAFLSFNRYDILSGTGAVSREKADAKAFAEYEQFNRHQRIESDFDRQLKLILDGRSDK